MLKIGDIEIKQKVLVAPMTGVSDLPFRRAASRLGAAYVATEMVACENFAKGRPDAVRRAAIGTADGDNPMSLMVVQLVGRDPHWIAQGAKLAQAAGADIIDLNFGCPSKDVVGVQCGAALMREPDLAARLIDAAVGATHRPVTLKMRLGWDDASRNAPALAAMAQARGVQAITVHGRTRNQFYKGHADWNAVAAVKSATRLPVIVNGDIVDVASARQALRQSGADAVMMGRGIYGRPWASAAIAQALENGTENAEPGPAQRLGIVLEHFRECLRFYGDVLGLKIFRKHLGWYIEQASFPVSAADRRVAKAKLCQIDQPGRVELALCAFWSDLALSIG